MPSNVTQAREHLLSALEADLIGPYDLPANRPDTSDELLRLPPSRWYPIRERLYCAPSDAEPAMAGILLSTGSAGSEGTLGGLVEEGKRLDRHLHRALEMASLCANDPVCGGHTPQGDYAERFLEGAGACWSKTKPLPPA